MDEIIMLFAQKIIVISGMKMGQRSYMITGVMRMNGIMWWKIKNIRRLKKIFGSTCLR
jgi:hypothetical protein